LGGIALTSGLPQKVAHNAARLAPGFVAEFSLPMYAAATLLTIAWCWLIFASPRSPWRGLSHWAAGVTLAWSLLMTLWLPWGDYGKSYRSVANSLREALPNNVSCIAGRDLGITQRVSLEYFADIRIHPANTPGRALCPLLLVQGTETADNIPSDWLLLWEGHRPSDRSERLRLFLRQTLSNGGQE
jgi:4-amino-4-deoxy-L-arabinose transferase-like glycosyltransferase